MVEKTVSCSNKEDMEGYIQNALDWCLSVDKPLRISSVKTADNGFGGIFYGYFTYDPSSEVMNTIWINFKIGHEVFEISRKLQERLIDSGKLVNEYRGKDATHKISIPWGTRAEDGKVAHWDYYVKMDDIDAFLATIKFGGRLSDIARG